MLLDLAARFMPIHNLGNNRGIRIASESAGNCLKYRGTGSPVGGLLSHNISLLKPSKYTIEAGFPLNIVCVWCKPPLFAYSFNLLQFPVEDLLRAWSTVGVNLINMPQ